jgi:hypothetical protein
MFERGKKTYSVILNISKEELMLVVQEASLEGIHGSHRWRRAYDGLVVNG